MALTGGDALTAFSFEFSVDGTTIPNVVAVTRGEMDMLNPMGVNSIKSFPGRGIRVWGGHTLSSDAEWRYVNVRRYFNYLEESILQGTQWCVFEPNDERLWGRIRRTISAFLVNEWRSGALFGEKAGQAFFVKCDGENNTAESIDAGMVIVEILSLIHI